MRNSITDQKGFEIRTSIDIEGDFDNTSMEVYRVAMIAYGLLIMIVEWKCYVLENKNLTTNKGNTILYGTAD